MTDTETMKGINVPCPACGTNAKVCFVVHPEMDGRPSATDHAGIDLRCDCRLSTNQFIGMMKRAEADL